jgi:cytochrome c oxidase subunit II
MMLAGMLLNALPGLPLAKGGSTFWMPADAATGAAAVDGAFYFILWVSIVFFALIVGLMLWFVIRYRRRPGHMQAEHSPHHSMALELTWTIIPVILVAVMFVIGFKTFLDEATPPDNSYEIKVHAQKWKWLFEYPNGWIDTELHVPLNEPVQLLMDSTDVIHSFYVPDFRVKKDVVPGRYTKVWFEATEAGEHNLFCAEFCGTGHSDMITKVIVHQPGGFETWLQTAANVYDTMPPAQAGAEMFKKYGCAQCHSIDGAANTGPTFKELFGSQVRFTEGQAVTADENYIRESILDPQAKTVAGFQGVMPTFQGRITDQQVGWIIEYLKSLSGGGQAEHRSNK